jgi:hypothetical protein
VSLILVGKKVLLAKFSLVSFTVLQFTIYSFTHGITDPRGKESFAHQVLHGEFYSLHFSIYSFTYGITDPRRKKSFTHQVTEQFVNVAGSRKLQDDLQVLAAGQPEAHS